MGMREEGLMSCVCMCIHVHVRRLLFVRNKKKLHDTACMECGSG